MMRKKYILLLILSALALQASGNGYRDIIRLHENGMHSRSRNLLHQYDRHAQNVEPAGWAVLNSVMMKTPGYENEMELYMKEYPYSKLAVQIRYHHALNLFHSGNYSEALEGFDSIKPKALYKSERTEYLFNRAYCNLELQQYDLAYERFNEVYQLPFSDYTGPSAYAMGYIRYNLRDFQEALSWFEKSVKDNRFSAISNWYIMVKAET